MPDLSHTFGGDVQVSANGDLLTASSLNLSQQRILRRLMTNPGDYIWQPSYGAGLAQFVGSPASAAQIRAVVRSQIFKEAAVARQRIEDGKAAKLYVRGAGISFATEIHFGQC